MTMQSLENLCALNRGSDDTKYMPPAGAAAKESTSSVRITSFTCVLMILVAAGHASGAVQPALGGASRGSRGKAGSAAR